MTQDSQTITADDPNAPIRKDLEALISKFEDGDSHDIGAFDNDCPTCRILEELRNIVSRDYDRYDQPATTHKAARSIDNIKVLANWCASMKNGLIRFNLHNARARPLHDAGLIEAVDDDWGKLTKKGSEALAQYWAHEMEENRRAAINQGQG